MSSRFCIIFCAFLSLLATVGESKLLMFDDFEEAKLNKKNWTHGVQANKILWKIENGHLEALPIGGARDISDIAPLANLTKLATLRLEWNKITDISPLSELTNLEYLNIHSNQLTDISKIQGFRGTICEIGLTDYLLRKINGAGKT